MLAQAELFWQCVQVGEETECWPWLGVKGNRKNPENYGKLDWGGICRGAHQVAWELHNGRSVTPGLEILHTCDRPCCCNPAHLKEDTHKANQVDAWEKGRLGTEIHKPEAIAKRAEAQSGNAHWTIRHPEWLKRGSAHGMSKFTEDDVAEIRRLRSEEGLSLPKIAARYGVAHGTIGMIVRGETWAPDGLEKRRAPKWEGLPTDRSPSASYGNRKIDWEVAREVRRVRAETGKSFRVLAKEFGISHGQIGQICRNQAWVEPTQDAGRSEE